MKFSPFKKLRSSFKILLVLSIISVSDCATFTYYPELPIKYEMVENFKVPEKKKTIKVLVNRIIISGEEEIKLTPSGVKRAENNFLEHLESTNVFSKVTAENYESDVQCDVIWQEIMGSSVALNLLSGFTLFVVPGSFESTVNLSMTFKNKKGILLKGYQRSVTFQTWVGWIMIPFTPFYFVFPEVEKGNREIIKSILQEAMKDKIF